jgi:hypothetical protein
VQEFDSKGLEIDVTDAFINLKLEERVPAFRIVEPLQVNGPMTKDPFKANEGKFAGRVLVELEGVALEKVDGLNRRAYQLMKKMGKTEGKDWKPLSHPNELRFSRKTGAQTRVMEAKITDSTHVFIMKSEPGKKPKARQQGSGREFFEQHVAPMKNVCVGGELAFKGTYTYTNKKGDEFCGVNKPVFYSIYIFESSASGKAAYVAPPLDQDEINKFFGL